MFHEAERLAFQDGRYKVLFFDEGDLLLSPTSGSFEERTVSHKDQSSSHRTSTSSSETTRSASQMGSLGVDILNSFKSALGGSLTRVFTIITSNRDSFLPELTREARLRPVRISPIAMKLVVGERNSQYPDYFSLREVINTIYELRELLLNVYTAQDFTNETGMFEREGWENRKCIHDSTELVVDGMLAQQPKIAFRNREGFCLASQARVLLRTQRAGPPLWMD